MLHMAPFIFAPTNHDLIKHLIALNVYPWFEPWMLPVKTRIGHNHYNHLEWPEKERVYQQLDVEQFSQRKQQQLTHSESCEKQKRLEISRPYRKPLTNNESENQNRLHKEIHK